MIVDVSTIRSSRRNVVGLPCSLYVRILLRSISFPIAFADSDPNNVSIRVSSRNSDKARITRRLDGWMAIVASFRN